MKCLIIFIICIWVQCNGKNDADLSIMIDFMNHFQSKSLVIHSYSRQLPYTYFNLFKSKALQG